jgi:DNA-directed RNA polymerase specialized sigma24 family protein
MESRDYVRDEVALLRKVLNTLTATERLVCLRKKVGFSDRQIALHVHGSRVSVGSVYSRAKSKIRSLLPP